MANNKVINLSKSVHALASEYPEVVAIMSELGFSDIVKPDMLNTAGRFMTIPKGAKMKGIDLELIKNKFIENGYELAEEEEK